MNADVDPSLVIYLSSGLFLGWALGANDAANVFGTAVGTRMIQFTTAATVCSIFVVLGAVISGAGAAHGLGKLGSINTLPGAFMAALSAAVAVYLMTKAGLPVSTTQAIVGSIVGWNLFSGTATDQAALARILMTWVVCPILAAIIAMVLYRFLVWILNNINLHLFKTDAYARFGLLIAGAFGSYSLGANNIGNVMGVFVPASPFPAVSILEGVTLSSIQFLFLFGAMAIAVGVFTYSRRVMMTVGAGLVPLSAVSAWVVVVSHSVVLFVFASQQLESFLASHGLPTIPLIPVSSSQAVVGAVLGIAILKGGRGIRWRVLGGIGMGWALTPMLAGLVCFVGLFFLQNVFDREVYERAARSNETVDTPYDLPVKTWEKDARAPSPTPKGAPDLVKAAFIVTAVRAKASGHDEIPDIHTSPCQPSEECRTSLAELPNEPRLTGAGIGQEFRRD